MRLIGFNIFLSISLEVFNNMARLIEVVNKHEKLSDRLDEDLDYLEANDEISNHFDEK